MPFLVASQIVLERAADRSDYEESSLGVLTQCCDETFYGPDEAL